MPDLTPSRLWMSLPADVKLLAARSYDWKAPESRREAELAMVRSLRFREAFIRKLSLEKRIGYVASAVRPDDPLAASLLLALHLEHRRPMLAAFMDALAIPHDHGVIDENATVKPPSPETLSSAVKVLDAAFPPDEVTLYLKSLMAVDPETWSGLRELIAARS